MRKSSWVTKLAVSIVMISIACAVAFPFYYIVVNTFKTQQQTSESPLGLPTSLNLTNYKSVWDNIPVLHSFENTLQRDAAVGIPNALDRVNGGVRYRYAKNTGQ